MQQIEKHLQKIKQILNQKHGLYLKLESVGAYLLDANELSCLSIYRRVGDEMDDHIFIAVHDNVHMVHARRVRAGKTQNDKDKIIIVPSRYQKPREIRKSFEVIPEYLMPIITFRSTVGFLHAEKALGGHFRPAEIRLMNETAKLLGRQFVPSVIHMN